SFSATSNVRQTSSSTVRWTWTRLRFVRAGSCGCRPQRRENSSPRQGDYRKERGMVVADTLDGTIHRTLWYHYDLVNDVLYVRLSGAPGGAGLVLCRSRSFTTNTPRGLQR